MEQRVPDLVRIDRRAIDATHEYQQTFPNATFRAIQCSFQYVRDAVLSRTYQLPCQDMCGAFRVAWLNFLQTSPSSNFPRLLDFST